MGATGLEFNMQRHEKGARDGGYALMSFHMANVGRKWWWMVEDSWPNRGEMEEMLGRGELQVVASGYWPVWRREIAATAIGGGRTLAS